MGRVHIDYCSMAMHRHATDAIRQEPNRIPHLAAWISDAWLADCPVSRRRPDGVLGGKRGTHNGAPPQAQPPNHPSPLDLR